MTLFFAVLFYVFIPGKFLTLPNSDNGPDDSMVQYTHALLFAIVLALSYEMVANFVQKNV
jgi:hypothetical protein